ncbi:MAG: PadR family transcriptional regulator [Eubacteriales bacterium]|nr:PadR family transcriptional regulator [Eubacteriales bacterium]
MIPSQMLKGTLEGCVLAIISKKETYGYEISEQLMQYGFGKIAEGTIYPLLLRLEKNDSIRATYKESGVGPRRKYYGLTPKGADTLQRFFHSFCELENAVDRLMQDTQGGM